MDENGINHDLRASLSNKYFKVLAYLDPATGQPFVKLEVVHFPADLLKGVLAGIIRSLDEQIRNALKKNTNGVNFDADNPSF